MRKTKPIITEVKIGTPDPKAMAEALKTLINPSVFYRFFADIARRNEKK